MEEKKKITLHPRRLARKLAKRQMDQAGATGYNKVPPAVGREKPKSPFSRNWRKIAKDTIRRAESGSGSKNKKTRR